MPAKTPMYLKTPTDRRGRKLRLRDVLSGDMISPPLGDVRHSAHVGPQGPGDMFGDVGFLQGNMGMLPPPNDPSLMWNTEEAPPKPPRLHLDTPPFYDTAPSAHQDTPPQLGSALSAHLDTLPQFGSALFAHLDTLPQFGSALSAHLDTPSFYDTAPSANLDTPPPLGSALTAHLDTPPHYDPTPSANLDTPPQLGSAPCPLSLDLSLSPTIRRLVPSSNSSSEDSLLGSWGPLGVPQGLSLDCEAALSNEDLSGDYSPVSSPLPRSESLMTSLDLDLGPSIMEDVLRIMDHYRGPSLAPDS